MTYAGIRPLAKITKTGKMPIPQHTHFFWIPQHTHFFWWDGHLARPMNWWKWLLQEVYYGYFCVIP